MELKVVDIKGKETGKIVQLDDSIFSVEPNNHAIYLDVKQYMANSRQGTHKAKERWEVIGSTKKLHRQKGTGGARIGDIKSPLLRGGGRVFGPKPRDYSFKLNKKVKVLARKSALTEKASSKSIIVVEDFSFESPKTKNMVDLQKNLNISNKKSLLVLSDKNNNIYLSSRNLQECKVATVSEITTYDIVNAKVLLLTESSVDILKKQIN